MALSGSNIVITRPAHQAVPLVKAIEALGGNPIRFPTIKIVERISADTRAALRDGLASYDLAIFVSANAVRHGVPMVCRAASWPEDLRIGAVGPGTAAALNGLGLSVDLVPEKETGARGLLASSELAALAIAGQRVVIFRGHGGLPELGDELSARGAEVFLAEVYERQTPAQDATPLNARGVKGEIDIIVVTSAEALRNLFVLVGEAGRDWLRDTRFLVVSERIAQVAGDYCLRQAPLVARGSSERAILEALVHWREGELAG